LLHEDAGTGVPFCQRHIFATKQGQTMGSEWFYEYDGKKIGPIPSETLRHLARHGAISKTSPVWKQGMSASVHAEKVKGLFDSSLDSTSSTVTDSASQGEPAVIKYLRAVLDACCDDDTGNLMKGSPSLGFVNPWSVAKVLLSYEIGSLEQLPTPVVDMSLPLGKRTKPVKSMFQVTVHAVLCVRPAYATTMAEVRKAQPGRHEEDEALICKEFEDGSWVFMSSSLG
jgi:hypothetical protein